MISRFDGKGWKEGFGFKPSRTVFKVWRQTPHLEAIFRSCFPFFMGVDRNSLGALHPQQIHAQALCFRVARRSRLFTILTYVDLTVP